MKPGPFEYAAPDSLEEALSLLTEHGDSAKLLAGGQSLVPLMNFRLAQPTLLVDMNRIEDLGGIGPRTGGGLSIGALTRVGQLERDSRIATEAPLMAEALPWIAHPQIRNRSTIGGSLAHADPAAELPAIALALDFELRIRRTGSERTVAARDFFVGLLTTDLAPEEIVVEIGIPPAPQGSGWSFKEVARRRGDYAQVGVAAGLTLDESGRCVEARLVFLSVGDVPSVAGEASRSLVGEDLGDTERADGLFEAAARHAAAAEIQPGDDLHSSASFKRHLAGVLTLRALREARNRALGGVSPEPGGLS